jgi:hypothetical protein
MRKQKILKIFKPWQDTRNLCPLTVCHHREQRGYFHFRVAKTNRSYRECLNCDQNWFLDDLFSHSQECDLARLHLCLCSYGLFLNKFVFRTGDDRQCRRIVGSFKKRKRLTLNQQQCYFLEFRLCAKWP